MLWFVGYLYIYFEAVGIVVIIEALSIGVCVAGISLRICPQASRCGKDCMSLMRLFY